MRSVVQVVCPLTGGRIHSKRAIRTRCVSAEGRCRVVVHVTGCHLSIDTQDTVFFDLRSLHAARDHWRIVRACDRHCHRLLSRGTLVVRYRHGEGLCLSLTSLEVLVRVVGHVVRPLARFSIHCKRAVGACRITTVSRCCAMVHVARGHLTANAKNTVFLHCCCLHDACDHRRIVRAVHRERHRLACGRFAVAHTIVHRHRSVLACRQAVVCSSFWIDREAVCCRVVRDACWQVRWHIHHAQHVACVHIARVGQRVNRH